MEQIHEEVSFTAGPIQVRGNMAVRDKKKIKRADYILYYKPNRPIIYKNRFGRYSFAVPLMGEFIRRQHPADSGG